MNRQVQRPRGHTQPEDTHPAHNNKNPITDQKDNPDTASTNERQMSIAG